MRTLLFLFLSALSLMCAVPFGSVMVTDGTNSWWTNTPYLSGGLTTAAGQSVSNVVVSGLMYRTTTLFTNLNGSGTLSNLGNVSIAGNVLTNAGSQVQAVWQGVMANSVANTQQFQIVFGSQTILDTGLQPASNSVFRAECWIIGTGSTAQRAFGHLEWGPSGLPGTLFTFTNSAVNIVQSNGVPTILALKSGALRAGAHTNTSFRVYYEP